MRLLTKEEKLIYEEELDNCNEYDTEIGHMEADKILCKIFKKMGYINISEIFINLPKWYA